MEKVRSVNRTKAYLKILNNWVEKVNKVRSMEFWLSVGLTKREARKYESLRNKTQQLKYLGKISHKYLETESEEKVEFSKFSVQQSVKLN